MRLLESGYCLCKELTNAMGMLAKMLPTLLDCLLLGHGIKLPMMSNNL